jgi:type IV secretory pathway VirJ component
MEDLTLAVVEQVIQAASSLEFLDVAYSGTGGRLEISQALSNTIHRRGITVFGGISVSKHCG